MYMSDIKDIAQLVCEFNEQFSQPNRAFRSLHMDKVKVTRHTFWQHCSFLSKCMCVPNINGVALLEWES